MKDRTIKIDIKKINPAVWWAGGILIVIVLLIASFFVGDFRGREADYMLKQKGLTAAECATVYEKIMEYSETYYMDTNIDSNNVQRLAALTEFFTKNCDGKFEKVLKQKIAK